MSEIDREDPIESILHTAFYLEGETALHTLLKLIHKHPKHNYEYYLITRTDAVQRALKNLQNPESNLKSYSLLFLATVVKPELTAELPENIREDLENVMQEAMQSNNEIIKQSALQILDSIRTSLSV